MTLAADGARFSVMMLRGPVHKVLCGWHAYAMLMYSTGSECFAGNFVPLTLRFGKPQKHDFKLSNLVMTIELFTIGCSFYRASVACGLKHFRASSG
jgi:hypothetical protein